MEHGKARQRTGKLMTDYALIHQILVKKSIVDYLEKKGYHPYKTLSDGKIQYLCPFPDHNESQPSFMVWTSAEYENFYCFGCLRNYNIIHLVSALEGISFGEAVAKLGDGMEVSLQENIQIEKERFDKMQVYQIPDMLDLSESLTSIGIRCASHLQGVNYDNKECEIVDKLLETVDKDLLTYEFDNIQETCRSLGNVLIQRRQRFEEEKGEKRKKEYKRGT
ncbi:hypothetical protein LCGC14_0997250 [marine sediment metagenome]|uniref:Zinc finger CHC2-type domain-containing protein n=1 Tax=marine sediment metagenome TaxID=412755 RepID=A0A0F9RAB0_9ZZZZ